MWKSQNEMQINPPVVFTFMRQRWSSTTFSFLPAMLVWTSNIFFTQLCCIVITWMYITYGPVPADQALRVWRSRPVYMTGAASLKPRGERESGTSLTGTGYRVRWEGCREWDAGRCPPAEFSTDIFVAYSKGCRIYIVSSKLLVRAPLSDVPRNNLKSGVATVALELGFRPRSTQL